MAEEYVEDTVAVISRFKKDLQKRVSSQHGELAVR